MKTVRWIAVTVLVIVFAAAALADWVAPAPYARQFRAALDMPLVLLGGINRLDTVTHALDDGFAFVQMGRALLREPELLLEMQKDPTRESLCIHCNKCMPTIYTGTRCVIG